MKYYKSLGVIVATASLFVSTTSLAALYLGKINNLSKTKSLTLQSISLTSGERQPPSQIPPEKGGFFSISSKQKFLTFLSELKGNHDDDLISIVENGFKLIHKNNS